MATALAPITPATTSHLRIFGGELYISLMTNCWGEGGDDDDEVGREATPFSITFTIGLRDQTAVLTVEVNKLDVKLTI